MDQPCAVTSSVSSTIVVIWVPFRVTFVTAQTLTLPALSVVKYILCSKPTPTMSTEKSVGSFSIENLMPHSVHTIGCVNFLVVVKVIEMSKAAASNSVTY